ncbi:MAG: hypothetical protein GX561_04605 [Lentisphaerae bacterium]|jgi:epoxyqueuosine reductase|nr:hypothetical protein [Lentisphaerota bacterium]
MKTFPKDTLVKWIKELGLDMVGVADPKYYENIDPQWNPLSILPTCKSIIVFAREIPRSHFRGIEDGTVFNRVKRFIGADEPYQICRRFEDNGFLAVPCTLLAQERWPDGIGKPGKPAPNVAIDPKLAAQLAGLGEIGYNGTFITPQFGPRQALGVILCDAQMEADQPFVPNTLCDRSKCKECVKACPAKALTEKTITIDIGGHPTTIAVFNESACKFCPNGAYPDTSCETAPPNRIAAACTRACIACLEDSGKVKTNFKKPFRRRTPWAFDIFQA